MDEIKKIERYIQNTGCPETSRYTLPLKESCALTGFANCKSIFQAVFLAFEYGRAKGYRQAKAEGKTAAGTACVKQKDPSA